MKLNDKNIDQVFRDAAQNSAAPRYDRSYWKEVNSILNDEDKRKRGFLIWSVTGSIGVVILVSTLFMLNSNESTLQIADNVTAETHETFSEQKDGSKINKYGSFQNETNSTGSANSNVDISNKEVPSVNNTFDNSVEKTEILVSKQKSNESVSSPLSSQEFVLISDSHAFNEDINDPMKNKHLTKDNRDLENGSDLNKSLPTEDLAIESLSPRLLDFEQIEVAKNLLPYTSENHKVISFYAKLSAGLMENYETSRPFQSGVFDFSLNLEYQKDQVLFRTGLGLQATSNADIVVSERAKVYGFGLTTHQNNLSYQNIYDIYIPIELGYSLNNTSFGFGLQSNYMVSTTMNYESLENNIVMSEAKLKGFREGLNSFTAQGYLWLEQTVSKRFSAGIKVGTNLNSRINEGRYFNESATTNPLYGQLTLRYNLIK